MAEDNARRELGLKMFEEVYGGVVPVPPPEFRTGFFNQTIDQLFSEGWSRTEVSIKERRLITLGEVAALGEVDMFEIQMRAALKKGELTRAQVEDIVMFLPAYVGYPRTSKILLMTQRVFKELNI